MLMNVSENSLCVYDSSEQPVLDLVNVRITLAALSFELAAWSCGMKIPVYMGRQWSPQ